MIIFEDISMIGVKTNNDHGQKMNPVIIYRDEIIKWLMSFGCIPNAEVTHELNNWISVVDGYIGYHNTGIYSGILWHSDSVFLYSEWFVKKDRMIII